MADKNMKVGTKVEVTATGKRGTIAFIGTTAFAQGKWVGVILESPEGKNNGTVQGKAYFSCPENYGLFVRTTQLAVLDDGSPGSTPSATPTATPVKTASAPSSTPATKPSGGLKPPGTAGAASRLQAPRKSSAIKPPTSHSAASAASSSEDITQQQVSASTESLGSAPVSTESVEASREDLAANSAEVQMLRDQVQDLNEKLNSLKLKRAEDRDKLKELSTLKLQVTTIPEYKGKITELQKELQTQTKKFEETKAHLEAELEQFQDIGDTIEMLTIDKEMSEEKCDTLKIENEALLMKVQELSTDLNVIKSEIETKGTDGAANDFQYKQLEAQYNRQKEAILRLRELMTEESNVRENLERDHKKLEASVNTLKNERDKFANDKQVLETKVEELQEHVNAALGSVRMVEALTERNMELEEQISTMEEDMQGMEELKEINEEIMENFKEQEVQLREELDMKESDIRQLTMKAEQLMAGMNDCQNTIMKFRQLVQTLQEENKTLKSAAEETANTKSTGEPTGAEKKSETANLIMASPIPASPAMTDFKTKQNAALNVVKSLDSDMKDLEIKQNELYISYLLAYLPDSFDKSAAELDCIKVLLLLPRLVTKISVIVKHVKLMNEITDSSLESPDFTISDNVCFSLSFSVQLLSLQSLVRQISYILSSCSVERYTRIGSLHQEILIHEKSIDQLVSFFKKDQLDDTVKLDSITRAHNFFSQLLNSVLYGETWDQSSLLEDNVSLILEASNSAIISCRKITKLVSPNSDIDEFIVYVKDTVETMNDIRRYCRKLKKQFPAESGQALTVKDVYQSETVQAHEYIKVFSLSLFHIAREAEIAASVLAEGEYLPCERLCEIRDTCLAGMKQKYSALKPMPTSVHAFVTQMCRLCDEGEFERTPETVPTAPVFIHARESKAEQLEQGRAAVDADGKESELKDLKILMKQKEEEVSSLNVKIGLLEQKVKSAPKVYEEKLRVVKEELEKVHGELDKQKKTYEITLGALETDIKELETEKADLKTRLNNQSKQALFKGVAKFAEETTAKPSVAMPDKVVDSPLLKEEIANLRSALKFVTSENWLLKGEKMRTQLKSLKPLPVLQKPTGLASTTGLVPLDGGDQKSDLGKLTRSAASLVSEIERLCANPRVVDLTKRKAGSVPAVDKLSAAQQLVDMSFHKTLVKKKLDQLHEKVFNYTAIEYPLQLTIDDNKGSESAKSASVFANRQKLLQMKQNLNPSLVAKVVMPKNKNSPTGSCTKVFLSKNQFAELHKSLVASY